MTRVPVTIKRVGMRFHPRRFIAWVPKRRTILVRRGAHLDRYLLAHELRHVTQAERHAWPLAYVLQWIATGFDYHRMRFEREARAAESHPAYLAWADALLEGKA